MATIHSLPPELLSHILTLAYDTSTSSIPPDPYAHEAACAEAKAGLRAAALVHSAWREPAQALLTAELHFGRRKPGALQLFLERVSAGFSCGRLQMSGLKVGEARAVLAHARAGGVTGLWLFGQAPLDLFALPALSDLRNLKLGDVRPKLNPLPTSLTNLEFVSLDPFPHQLVAASGSTLTRLDLILHHPSHLAQLASLAPALTSLRHLNLDCCSPELAVSSHAADLERLVSHLPQLASLRLPPLWPALLERVLGALPASAALRRLQVKVIVAENADAESARLEGPGGWLVTLERCIRLPVLSRLVELDVGPGLRTAGPEPVWWSLADADLAAFLNGREGARDGWDAFRAKVAEAGVELLCWSKPHEELVEMVALSQTDGP